jgi:hypothetical protein
MHSGLMSADVLKIVQHPFNCIPQDSSTTDINTSFLHLANLCFISR